MRLSAEDRERLDAARAFFENHPQAHPLDVEQRRRHLDFLLRLASHQPESQASDPMGQHLARVFLGGLERSKGDLTETQRVTFFEAAEDLARQALASGCDGSGKVTVGLKSGGRSYGTETVDCSGGPCCDPESQQEGRGELDGAALITAERQRQVEAEGYSPEHDDQHTRGELARAGGVYAMPYNGWWKAEEWPFEPESIKHDWRTVEGRIRELARAGALIAAEIDRLQRAALNPEAT